MLITRDDRVIGASQLVEAVNPELARAEGAAHFIALLLEAESDFDIDRCAKLVARINSNLSA